MDYAGGSRAVVNDSPEGLEIVIPAPRIWPVVIFLACWLAGWVTGEVFALRQILAPSPLPAKAFLAFWLVFWTLGGGVALSACVWMLAGHERVRLRTDALTIQREAFGLGPVTVYEFGRIRDLRAQPLPSPTDLALPGGGAAGSGPPALDAEKAAAVVHAIGIGGPGIAFTYAGRPVRFGVALDPMEARSVVAQLEARHPFDGDRTAA